MSRITMNTNLASLNSQRHLGNATQKLQQNFSRLSSGMRINSASDDAAGLSVSSLLNADRAILNQGIRNLNDGVSYLNIAEGAINEMTNIMFRIKEIAEQSANGTLSNDQRKPLQDEVTALQKEYNRILQSTEFNDIKLLTGENTRMELQAGFGIAGSLATQVGKALVSDDFGVLAAGQTFRASTSSEGNEGNGDSMQVNLSSDGKYAIFRSTSSNLISGVSGLQIYRKNLETGKLDLVSSSSDGDAGNSASIQPSISADGNTAIFRSSSTNLISGISGTQIYSKDINSDEISLVSSTNDGIAGDGVSTDAAMSHDGRFVAFLSDSTNLLPGVSGPQIYLKDTLTGELSLASSSSDGATGNNDSSWPTISADGRYAVFSSKSSNLISGVTGDQVYMKDLQTEEISLVSSSADGTLGDNQSLEAEISANSKFISFTSVASNLIPGVSGSQVYIKNIETGEISLGSSGEDGSIGDGLSMNPTISADGRYVAYRSSSTNLVDGVSGTNVFRKDLLTGEVELVSRSDTEIGDNSSVEPEISADGNIIAFHSNATNLIENDTNGGTDIFYRDMSKAGVQELSGMVVNSQVTARTTLNISKEYLDSLALARASIGASSSRINTALSNLGTITQNLANASSQITDTDVAEESSKLTSNQILQQTATSVLAQANSQPGIVLRLLENV